MKEAEQIIESVLDSVDDETREKLLDVIEMIKTPITKELARLIIPKWQKWDGHYPPYLQPSENELQRFVDWVNKEAKG